MSPALVSGAVSADRRVSGPPACRPAGAASSSLGTAFPGGLGRGAPPAGPGIRPAAYDSGRTPAAGLRRYGGRVSGELRAPLTARLRRLWVALDYAVAAGCAVIIFGMLFQSRSGTGFD